MKKTYKVTDEHNDVHTEIDNLDDAIDLAKQCDADVFDEQTGECVWVNPEVTWA